MEDGALFTIYVYTMGIFITLLIISWRLGKILHQLETM